ncbi:hypothetical protein M3Y97_01101700 [Aphelenchoides bicaudatus]|nr:hypothetical protein M3Y97_01101700 [Aphelenchoides bicaudatus]
MLKKLFATFILIPIAFCFDSRFPTSQLISDARVGTPQRTFYLRLETGSPNAWIINGKYPTPSDDNNPYNASLSSTSKPTNTYSEVYSGVYNASGYDTSDSFEFDFDFAGFSSYQKFTSVEKILSDFETNPEIELDGVPGTCMGSVKNQ